MPRLFKDLRYLLYDQQTDSVLLLFQRSRKETDSYCVITQLLTPIKEGIMWHLYSDAI